MKCEQCKYWVDPRNAAEEAGECRRHAPRAQDAAYERLGVRTMWPSTRRTDWCWEFAVAPKLSARMADLLNVPREAA